MERYLVLDDNTVYQGQAFGATNCDVEAEITFITGMSGYQEAVSDPSFHGQFLIFTYPSIGNAGINADDDESLSSYCAGVIVYEHAEHPSNWRSVATFAQHCEDKGIPGISGIDTRSLIKKIRQDGIKKAKLVSSLNHEAIEIRPSVTEVSSRSSYRIYGNGLRVTLLDLGMKQSILRELSKRNCRVHVLPHNASYEEILATHPDGVLISNGPGDPSDCAEIVETIQALHEKTVLFGICLGHQLMARSFGAETIKMDQGHRGSNHAVRDMITDQVMMTSQNHGYVVSDKGLDSLNLIVTHREINDETIEGIRHRYYPAMSVQFHPDATPGPHDALSIFDEFIETMHRQKEIENDQR